MSEIIFRYKTDLTLAATPSNGSYIIAYDINTGFLSQKDDQGVIKPIGEGVSHSVTNDVFYNLDTSTSATNSTSSIYRTGSLNIGTGTMTNSRFVVSSSGGTNSLIVSETGTTTLIYDSPYGFSPGNNTLVLKNKISSGVASFGVTTDGNLRLSTQALILLNGSDQLCLGRFNKASIQAYGGPLVFYRDSDVETMRIMNVTGNVGINTTSPSTKLHVYATQSGAFR